MITRLRIKNFKAWKDTEEIRLAPITVFFGANSAGKSSIGHLLLALKQTALSADRKRAFNLGDGNSLIDLGTFADCLHGHDLSKELSFEIEWKTGKPIVVSDPLHKKKSYRGSSLSLAVELVADKTNQPRTSHFAYQLNDGRNTVLEMDYQKEKTGEYNLTTTNYELVKAMGRPWPVEEPEKFYKVSEKSKARYQNADFMSDFALEVEELLSGLHYLGPLRESPKRIYSWSGDTPEDVGQQGQYSIAALLAAKAAGRQLNMPRSPQKSFDEFIAIWLKRIGVIDDFKLNALGAGRKDYEVVVRTSPKSSEVKITDVGFGVSQVLPAVVQAFYAEAGATVLMEQPEIHLHPQVQAELADAFIAAVQAKADLQPRNLQLIIESHSEHFLQRLQRRIAEGCNKKRGCGFVLLQEGRRFGCP